ncbi:angiopoietin-related protein 7-like isoform X2 [Drosophila sulfurigaster albostrigata]|uniref:angiopoietin-related protein 7-like isoform X2 n=1 Tax=Drosophila sulfurigaster albostrigata TaxID=89887 RepID=UPI002D21B151|nr:angiopoietin-related protein 7-like isoform X2 [Drosophila sulfurigaster albostrigata]
MCKIKINSVLFLIVLEIFMVTTTAFEETCKFDRKMEEQCLNHTYKTVKPLLDYLRQVLNELKESEIDKNKFNELNSDLMEKYHEIVKIHEKFMKDAALLDEYKNKVLKGEDDLQLSQSKVEKLESEINSQQNIIVTLKGELADNSTNLENCQLKFQNLNSSLIEKDEKIKRFSENIQNNTEYQKTLELKLEKSKTKLIKQDKDIQIYQFEIDTLNRTSENIREQQKKIQLELNESETKLIDKVKENQLCQSEIDILNKTLLNTLVPSSCSPFGDSDVHPLNVSGIGFFDVLCDSQIAGPGWIVIQQRVGGDEDFNRDWATYRKGFGSYKSDFFLGLEKIHRITSLQRFELYIHLVAVNGSVFYAGYDDFKISDEDNGYALSLGKFSETIIIDSMRYSENMKFSTFDRDNDFGGGNCADFYKSGWWYNACQHCNLNKEYVIHQSIDLKEIKMLVRPKQ